MYFSSFSNNTATVNRPLYSYKAWSLFRLSYSVPTGKYLIISLLLPIRIVPSRSKLTTNV